MIASILKEAGYKVGLYTSPHIFDYTERIKINGRDISKKELSTTLEKVRKAARSMKGKPTIFEVLTAASFLSFAKNKIDIPGQRRVRVGNSYEMKGYAPVKEGTAFIAVGYDQTQIGLIEKAINESTTMPSLDGASLVRVTGEDMSMSELNDMYNELKQYFSTEERRYIHENLSTAVCHNCYHCGEGRSELDYVLDKVWETFSERYPIFGKR